MVLRESWLKRYNVQRFECVGADTSRPPGTGIERFVYTAHVRYLSGGWYPPLRSGASIHRTAIKTTGLRGDKLPPPTQSETLGDVHSSDNADSRIADVFHFGP